MLITFKLSLENYSASDNPNSSRPTIHSSLRVSAHFFYLRQVYAAKISRRGEALVKRIRKGGEYHLIFFGLLGSVHPDGFGL